MIKISQGKIRLENKVIDLSTFNIRPKITEWDLETHYNSFLGHIEEIGDYFEDTSAFDKAVKDADDEKRPKLISREPKYPFMWVFRDSFSPFDYLKPSKRKLHDDYFMCGQCTTAISRKNEETKEGEKPLDLRLREDITEKFKKYQGYEGIIEIPNDRTQPETKSTTFHEALHYVIFRYQAETRRNFVDAFVKKELSQLEEYQAEHLIHERAVEILTDKLLTHDPDAQFENRWIHYSMNDGFRHLATAVSGIATGIIIGTSIAYPYLLPAALVPGRIGDYFVERHKKSKRKEILKPIEYSKFKI